jgi:UDP-glucose 4-epimerase
MAPKEKRTYNLTAATVRAVRELADEYHAAPTQDAVVELAVSELARRLRDEAESAAWETAAASDLAFRAESEEIEDAYRGADRETWPA